MKIKEAGLESIEIIGKTLLSSIPVGGTLITCVWDSIKAHAVQERLDDWKNKVEQRLKNLEISVYEIGKNKIFSSVMMKTTDIAIKVAESEKREYLANAVYNSVETDILESILMIYLNMLEEYTCMHIKILDYFRNPKLHFPLNMQYDDYGSGSAIYPLFKAYPELEMNEKLVEKIVKDFQNSGLMVDGSYLHGMMSSNGMFSSRTTQLGNDFLDFITFKI